MPERFARPQLVVRQKGAAEGPQVDILEQHRWSSSFENELRDALAQRHRGAARRRRCHQVAGARAASRWLRIAVQLRQFDAVESSRVDASFSWTVRRTDEGPATACQLSLSEPVGNGIEALAVGAQRVTAKLADAVARSVQAAQCLT